ncbi:NACHT, LRR and PYD domains-containing protein 3-like isoform X4 [Erpetoichthys calabaricus]|uniref:NACHT, LRR and PYD domains-containing protein 3-like isoform X4 n=1 Tax=Erpetoichthys calabaricus TaxID=27687 RepID=UPI0022340917|nr:NACHT, LRR and PYD domains-containing protein 3-like isoform X4 [Erpetoichthys calabaricus]
MALSSLPSKKYASSGDVECDFCIGKKFRAVKSCLTCMASFCQTHLQHHYKIAAWKGHKLTDPEGNLEEKLCAKHQKSLEMFCKTDKTCICMMCGLTEHNGHEKVELETERQEQQKQLGATWREIRGRLAKKEKKLKEMRMAMEKMKISVERQMEEHEKTFADMIHCIEETHRKLIVRIREQEKREMEKAEAVMEQLKKEIEELKRRDTELMELSETKDHVHFLQNFSSCCVLPADGDSLSFTVTADFSCEDLRKELSCLKKSVEKISQWDIKTWTSSGKKLLEEIDTSDQSPVFDPRAKDLHKTHRQAVSESTRALEAQASPGDPHSRAVGFETQYTELVAIKQDTRNHKVTEHKLVKTGRIHEELMNKGAAEKCERIWTEQLFRKSPVSVNPVNIIVVSGMVGIGKTTMIQKIMYDWARGTQYQRFAFMFLFKFREFNLLDNENEPQMSLTKLIERHYKYLSNDPLKDVLKNPKTLLFIFDGLDEYKHKLNFTPSQLCTNPDVEVPVHILVTSLVSQTLLKGCSVLITSRPTALGSLDMERVDGFAEIVGFFPEQRLMYFKKFFGEAALSTKAFRYFEERVHRFAEFVGFFPEQRLLYLKRFFGVADMSAEASKYVEENPILYSMFFSPSYCWIICSALKSHFMTPEEERGAAPKTVTEIFVMFLHNILTSHRQEAEDQILLKLEKMAYYGVENNIHEFNEKQEMSNFSLQPVLSSPFISGLLQRQSTQEHTTYTFYHLTLQEFMAACSVYRDPPEGIEELLMKWDSCKDGRFEIVTRFMAGLAWCPVLKTLEGILGEFEGTTTQRIQEWVRQKAKQALHGQNKSEAVRVCHWLYETQNKELIRDAIGEALKMNFRNISLYPLDCAVLAAVISCCGELQKLDLTGTPLTPQCIRRLAEGLSCCSEVWLRSCGFTSACCSALSSVFSSPNSQLTELVLNNNNLGDSGARQLSEGLRSDNCKLEKLGLYSCGLTSACCSALSSVLSSPNSQLTELDLDINNLGDSGAHQLSEGLRSDNCKLETLWLVSCGLTSACCSALSSVLSSPDSRLTELWLNNNNLGDSGAHQLSEGLRSDNCKLEKLELFSCGLTSACCSALSSVLSSPNSQLTELNLDFNNLGDSGARQLSEGLRSDNCKLKKLMLENNGISESEMMNLRSLQEELRRSGHHLTIYTCEDQQW